MAKQKEKYCSRCGKMLIFSYYRKPGSSYKLCKKCYREKRREDFKQEIEYKKEMKQQKIADRIERTGMRQSYFSMIIKILLGVLFIYSSAHAFLDKDYGVMRTALIIGAAFLAWGILPFIFRKKP